MSPLPSEVEPELVTTRGPRPILWGSDDPAGRLRYALDEQALGLADAIRDDARNDLETLLVVLASSLRTRRHVVPLFVRGNAVDGTVNRELPNFPGGGQWVLEAVAGWADPAATAAFQANVTLDASFPIPIPVALAKTGLASVLLGGLPVIQQDTLTITTSGGANADRGVVLLIFKREG